MWNLIRSIPAQIVCTQTDYMCCLNNFVLFSVRFKAVNSGKVNLHGKSAENATCGWRLVFFNALRYSTYTGLLSLQSVENICLIRSTTLLICFVKNLNVILSITEQR